MAATAVGDITSSAGSPPDRSVIMITNVYLQATVYHHHTSIHHNTEKSLKELIQPFSSGLVGANLGRNVELRHGDCALLS